MSSTRYPHMILGGLACLAAYGCGSDYEKIDANAPKTAAVLSPVPSRILAFHGARSVGTVSVRAAGSDDNAKWSVVGEALGDVQVPHGAEVKLEIAGAPDLSALAALPPDAVTEISFGGAPIGEEQLKNIAGMTGLVGVNLNGSQITDAGLEPLRSLANLRKLGLGDTNITDAGVAKLTGLQNLERLWLSNTLITDEGLRSIAELKNLKRLILFGTKITDAGLVEAAKLPKLERLGLFQTKITDAGLEHLSGAQTLTEVMAVGTGVTEQGKANLRAKLPNVTFKEAGAAQ